MVSPVENCIISLGISLRYELTQLQQSLQQHQVQTDFKPITSYPPGCISQEESPYAFKYFLVKKYLDEGYQRVLYLDPSVTVKNNLQLIWQTLDQQGYFFVQNQHSVGEYCHDQALDKLGLSRSQVSKWPSLQGSFIGIHYQSEKSRQWLDRMIDLSKDGICFPGSYDNNQGQCSIDSLVKGHRHDQSIGGLLAHQLSLTQWTNPDTCLAHDVKVNYDSHQQMKICEHNLWWHRINKSINQVIVNLPKSDWQVITNNESYQQSPRLIFLLPKPVGVKTDISVLKTIRGFSWLEHFLNQFPGDDQISWLIDPVWSDQNQTQIRALIRQLNPKADIKSLSPDDWLTWINNRMTNNPDQPISEWLIVKVKYSLYWCYQNFLLSARVKHLNFLMTDDQSILYLCQYGSLTSLNFHQLFLQAQKNNLATDRYPSKYSFPVETLVTHPDQHKEWVRQILTMVKKEEQWLVPIRSFVDTSAVLVHHQGWADFMSSHPLVRIYCQQFSSLILIIRTEAKPMCEYMYSDLPNLILETLEHSQIAQPKFLKPYLYKKYPKSLIFGNGDLGYVNSYDQKNYKYPANRQYYHINFLEGKQNFSHSFYFMDRLCCSIRKNYCWVPRQLSHEQLTIDRFYKRDFLLLHEDPDRGLKINYGKIRHDLQIVKLDKISTQIFDIWPLLEQATEIHLIESFWAVILYHLIISGQLKIEVSKIYIHRYSRNRNYQIFHLPTVNWHWF